MVRYIADLHIHSLFSRATSKASHLHGLAAWACIKGINVLGTGDFTHPGWFRHLEEHLEEAEPGFFRLKNNDPASYSEIIPESITVDTSKVRFVLSSEISSIYKRHDKVRKVHNILYAPDFASVYRINKTLAGIGNIESDGRPILGLDSRNLLEILLEKAPQGFLIPAHIWTPWFSLFGSKSGFDTVEECYGDLSSHIFALETGLSSDPEMNRLISQLDRYTLISNSDCHSPSKLGREANIFHTDFDFFSMRDAIRTPQDDQGVQLFEKTIEFFPEEGKYHCDGHRKCGTCFDPQETAMHKGLCPVCNSQVTIGVLNRVMELADRQKPFYPKGSPGVHSLIPLAEVLSELVGTGPASKKVMRSYSDVIQKHGSEFNVLLFQPLEDVEQKTNPLLAEAVKRIRQGNVIRKPGFDGEFGVIKVFSSDEKAELSGQLSLFFNNSKNSAQKKRATRPGLPKKKVKKTKNKTL